MFKKILTLSLLCVLAIPSAFAQIDVLEEYRKREQLKAERTTPEPRPEPFAQGRDPADSITGAKYKELSLIHI